ncbi:putative gpi-anchored cell wall beta-endoglucanase [Diaporthe ampelina]|uniref:Probable glucan endo-1,3-beta-glucosidase eglC n=1 Tax=Diaporthe ampelina TaxID=1214573 RepID=A0A0G2F976_9PEZI|nr:putative gpi-anchored cell wall beta-endoglucanase [Diaporthe ampelina]
MKLSTVLSGLSVVAGTANAAIQGFNYGAFFNNQAAKQQVDFAYEFNKAKNLPNQSGWNAARLYTMVQWGTASDVVSAIPAAINSQTKLLLGLWTSGGSFQNEIKALQTAINQYGTAFSDLVVGISVGSEDLYRQSSGEVGIGPDELVGYINQVRSTIAGTPLQGKPIGHVDTWNMWLDGANSKVIAALDFVGMDAYPYFQASFDNRIENAASLFWSAYDQTKAAAQGKEVWVTETGWPVSGDTVNGAVPNAQNAQTFWKQVACGLISRNINTFWYDLQESQWGQANPDFGIYGAGDLGALSPQFDLSC